jgi:hypothetical protein
LGAVDKKCNSGVGAEAPIKKEKQQPIPPDAPPPPYSPKPSPWERVPKGRVRSLNFFTINTPEKPTSQILFNVNDKIICSTTKQGKNPF